MAVSSACRASPRCLITLSFPRMARNSGNNIVDSTTESCYIPCVENAMSKEPKSLQEAIVYFSNLDNGIDYLAIRRWPNGAVACPTCCCLKVKYRANRRTWTCSTHQANREF